MDGLKISFHDAERWFGEVIWYWANRLKTRIHSPEDLYHDILIRVVENDWVRQPTFSHALKKVVPVDPSHVITFVRSRMIDVVRRENKAPRGAVPISLPDRSVGDIDVVNMIKDFCPGIGPVDLAILIEIATPSEATISIAFAEQSEARNDSRSTGALRMNVNGAPRVTQAHVARALNLSTSRVALAVRRANGLLVV